jgi:hypothetical protein
MSVTAIVSAFRDSLARGQLIVQKCNECSKLNMYPRYACPFCQSENLGWQKVSGRGQLHSFTVLRLGAPQGFESDLPYALGVIKLEEGVQLLARLAPDEARDWASYKCDDAVEFVPQSAAQIAHRPCATFRRA